MLGYFSKKSKKDGQKMDRQERENREANREFNKKLILYCNDCHENLTLLFFIGLRTLFQNK